MILENEASKRGPVHQDPKTQGKGRKGRTTCSGCGGEPHKQGEACPGRQAGQTGSSK